MVDLNSSQGTEFLAQCADDISLLTDDVQAVQGALDDLVAIPMRYLFWTLKV